MESEFTKILAELANMADGGKVGSQEWNDKFDELILNDPTLTDEEKNDWINRIYDKNIKEHSGEVVMYDPETFEQMTIEEYKNKYKNE